MSTITVPKKVEKILEEDMKLNKEIRIWERASDGDLLKFTKKN